MRTLVLFIVLMGSQKAWAFPLNYSRVFAAGDQLWNCQIQLDRIQNIIQSMDQKKYQFIQGQCRFVEKGQYSYGHTKLEVLYEANYSSAIDTYQLKDLSAEKCIDLRTDLLSKFEKIDQVIVDAYCLKDFSRDSYQLGISRFQMKTWSFNKAYIPLPFTKGGCEVVKYHWENGLKTDKSLSLISECKKVRDFDNNTWFQLSSNYATRIGKSLKTIRAKGFCSNRSSDQLFTQNKLPILYGKCFWSFDGTVEEVIYYLDDILDSLREITGLTTDKASCENALPALVAKYHKPTQPVLYSYCAPVGVSNFRPKIYYRWKKIRN